MSGSTGATPSSTTYTTPAFSERLWRTSGIQSLACFIIAHIAYGNQPQVGASPTHSPFSMSARARTYNALRNSGAVPGDLVAVQGIGGLGHLGIQFANKFGHYVAAIGRGSENAVLAEKLGAHVYIDSQATNAAEELQKLGGARVILATAPQFQSHVRVD